MSQKLAVRTQGRTRRGAADVENQGLLRVGQIPDLDGTASLRKAASGARSVTACRGQPMTVRVEGHGVQFIHASP